MLTNIPLDSLNPLTISQTVNGRIFIVFFLFFKSRNNFLFFPFCFFEFMKSGLNSIFVPCDKSQSALFLRTSVFILLQYFHETNTRVPQHTVHVLMLESKEHLIAGALLTFDTDKCFHYSAHHHLPSVLGSVPETFKL